MKKNDFLSFGAGLAIRFANLVGGGIEASGIRLVDLSEESILREARRRTKLQNWGNERFQVPLRAIIEGHENDSNLTFVGRFIARQMLIHTVSNRLRIHNDLEKHPEILNGEIRRPLFVTGLPRSGTTLLYNLLAQDPGGRPLLYWEAFSPSPPPCPQTYDCDPRIKVAERSIATLYRALPSLKLIHEINPRGPAEDLLLLINTFVTPSLQGELPKYRKWLDEVGDEVLIASYKEYREQLLLLQWKVSKDHWVLKSPSHLFGLKALLEVFPDACVVQTHRDPAEAISSLLSLAVTISSLSVKTIKQKMLKEIIVKMLEQQLQRSMDARRGSNGNRIYDVRYQALIDDPLGTVRNIYRHFGYDCTGAMEECMGAYLSQNRQHKHGVHRHSLNDFHIDPDEIDHLFSGYCHRFQLKRR